MGVIASHINVQGIVARLLQIACCLDSFLKVTAFFFKNLSGNRTGQKPFDVVLGRVAERNRETFAAGAFDLLTYLHSKAIPVFKAAAVLILPSVEICGCELVQ